MEIKKDIFGITPKIGDTIIWNPPYYKGLAWGPCVGFSRSGLPKIQFDLYYLGVKNKDGNVTPKTGFVVKPNTSFYGGGEFKGRLNISRSSFVPAD